MSVVEIKNLEGKVIFTYNENDESRDYWDECDFSGVNLERANLEGVVWMDTKLRGANLKKADFYWAILFVSDLSETNCESTEFLGADLKQVNFTKANLKNANFGKSNLGGSCDVSGANFTDTNLHEAKFDETHYDDKTIFPKNFNPEKNGLVRIKNKYL